MVKNILLITLSVVTLASMNTVYAETPQQILDNYRTQAKTEVANFKDFSATNGETFFKNTHGSDWSCATCHTSNPLKQGKHASTSKAIDPLSPNANAKRFTEPAKVEKWFKRNCKDVLKRECTTLEKGDVMAYLMALKP
ncbi:DUF1924 domain-containing protein [Thiolinea disciformis]|uniref:DUF1924 domain-containing protein n=1 Tax=Thiolinea disciformis TaxID=125614 RepID=UPI000364AEF8|nr:DUF1924 domain-containing protein [Thiolinea disciformis]